MKKLFLLVLFVFSISSQSQVIDFGNIKPDDKLHLGVGSFVGGVSYTFYHKELGLSKGWSIVLATATSSFAGLTKEFLDENKTHGSFSGKDILNTSIGGLTGAFTFKLIIDRVDRRNTPESLEFRKAKRQARRDKRKMR